MSNTSLESIEDFLAGLTRQGIRIQSTSEGRLQLNGPEEVIVSVRDQIAIRKQEIVEFLSTLGGIHESEAISPVERPDNIPLSFAQQRLWFLQKMQPETGAYNLSFAVEVTGLLDENAFSSGLQAIVQRHEVFRTNFVSNGGEPSQEIAPSRRPIEVKEFDLRNQANPEIRIKADAADHASQPFDLSKDLLLRVSLYRIEEERSIILFTVHHIIADAWSNDILLRELGLQYRAHLLGSTADLPPLPIQYADFSIWQRNWLEGEVLETQLDYWRRKLGGDLPSTQIPTDFPRKRVQTFPGAVVNFSVPAEVAEKLQTLSRDHASSMFMTLLTAFKLLLRRYTNQSDLVVGTPIANRHRSEVEGLIGLFVNTLVLRTKLNPAGSFLDALTAVRETTLEAYQYQDLPFEKLVETLQPDRDMSLSPLFQVKFRLENAPEEEIDLPGLKLRRLPQELTSAKLDLSLDMYETDDGLVGGFEYNSDLFKAETIERMVRHFKTLLESLARNPTIPLSELAILPPEEELRQKREWNSHNHPYRDKDCFHHLFEAQVDRTPDATAVVFDGENRAELTYRELNAAANRIAHDLLERSIRPDQVVAICLDRSTDLVVSLLGVLKAGAAYLPLDRSYPKDRLQFLLEDSRASALITTSDLDLGDTPVRIDLDTIDLGPISTENPDIAVSPENLAYLIYT
ncbi:MAG: condensation domain-containing protein, partial [Verrucomicrobiota bacterium]